MVGVCWASVVPYTLVSYLGGWKHVQKVFGEEEKEFMNKFLWFLFKKGISLGRNNMHNNVFLVYTIML